MLNSTRFIKFAALALFNMLVSGSGSATDNVSSNETAVLVDASDLEKPPEVAEEAQMATVEKENPAAPEAISDGEDEAIATVALEPVMPLELKVPFSVDNADAERGEPKVHKAASNLFANSNQKKAEAIRLHGTVLTTSEQEVEKRNSPDGLGIAINVKN